MFSAGTAVVIGASIGGLLTARVLSDHYARVVVLDRDTLPDRAAARRGVPQGRQLHVLLARGKDALDELFPGLSAELNAAGVPLVDLHGDVHWYNDGQRMRRAPSPLRARTAPRRDGAERSRHDRRGHEASQSRVAHRDSHQVFTAATPGRADSFSAAGFLPPRIRHSPWRHSCSCAAGH